MTTKKREQNEFLLHKIGSPVTRALEGIGITRLEQLTDLTDAELLIVHGMGQKALGILRETLKANGLSFRASKKTTEGKIDKTIRSKMDAIFIGDGEAQFKAYD